MNVSFWERDSFLEGYDVGVIGGGIVGLAAASRYKELFPDARIAVLERSWLSDGATSKNAGFACFGSISELEDDLNNASFQQVHDLSVKRFQGLQRLLELYGAVNLGFEACGGYELFFEGEEELFARCTAALSKWNEAFEASLGFAPYRVERCQTFQGMTNLLGVITNAYEGSLDTGKLNQCIRQRALQLGVHIYNGVEVVELVSKASSSSSKSVEVQTKQGNWHFQQVWVCTNAFGKELIEELPITPKRNQVIITEELEDCPLQGTFHQLEGYIYFRNVGKRILLGGMRHLFPTSEATTERATTPELIAALSNYMSTRILGHTNWKIETQWSGILGMGEIKAPIIKQAREKVYVAVRLGGMGVALGTLVGEELVAFVTNE